MFTFLDFSGIASFFGPKTFGTDGLSWEEK